MAIFQYNLGQLWHGRQCYTMYHTLVDGTPNNAGHAAFMQGVIDAYQEVLGNNLSTAWATNSGSFRQVDIPDMPTISISGLAHVTGAGVGLSVSRDQNILMRFFANAPAPNRGWRFIGGMVQANWNGTGWVTAIRDNVELLAEAIIEVAATSYEGLDSSLRIVRWHPSHTYVSSSNACFAGDVPAWSASQNERRF